MNRLLPLALLCAVATLAACSTSDRMLPGKAEYMVVGIDNKVMWGDDGKVQFTAPGKDLVTIVDIGTDPANPKIVASLPLMNSIFGPPTNLSITPNGQLALVANSMDWMQEGPGWRPAPDNKLHSSTSRPALRGSSIQLR